MLPKISSRFSPNLHDYILLAYLVLFIISVLGLLCQIIFGEPNLQLAYLLFALFIFFSSLVIFAIIYLFYSILERIHNKCNTGIERQCKLDMLLGLSGSCLAGIVPRYMAFYFENVPRHPFGSAYFAFISLFTILLLHYLFVFPAKIHISTKANRIISWLLALINLLVLICTTHLAIGYDTPKIYGVLACEIGFSLICASCVIELVRVMRGRVEMKKEAEESENLNTSKDVNTPEEWVPKVVIVTKPAAEPSVVPM
ncbi:hypothetical protein GCK72_016490 [Caenorhabditis remanei]|uniref:Uncharacterized protein n=1 Tax=Caenorhabditis remanei TaxID=31234 RepID=A0A6A5G5J9_CAERE|nr:hypothetical protein GCK72_016490 [Caenorhabditis remanei]KAF1749945.1 hypothetical protein GCK72_016490 [Caenorhabditis remanei]